MKCDECKIEMVSVGMEYRPGNRSVWAKAWVCPNLECGGYGQSHNDGTSVQSTALTLDPGACIIHARIAGALDMKKALR